MEKTHETGDTAKGTFADSESGTIEFERNDKGQTAIKGTVNPGFEVKASAFSVTIAPVQPAFSQTDDLPERTKDLDTLARKWVNLPEEKGYDMVKFLDDETRDWDPPVKESTFKTHLQSAVERGIISQNPKTRRFQPA